MLAHYRGECSEVLPCPPALQRISQQQTTCHPPTHPHTHLLLQLVAALIYLSLLDLCGPVLRGEVLQLLLELRHLQRRDAGAPDAPGRQAFAPASPCAWGTRWMQTARNTELENPCCREVNPFSRQGRKSTQGTAGGVRENHFWGVVQFEVKILALDTGLSQSEPVPCVPLLMKGNLFS